MSIDTLDMHAHYDSFHRFDKFNLKYNPIGESRLREIFLKTDNLIKGRYLAELTKGMYNLPAILSFFQPIFCRGNDRFRTEQIPGPLNLKSVTCVWLTQRIKNCEWRMSIYGRSLDEWDKLARWIVNNKLFSHNVRWLIQVPRLYEVYKANGSVETFEDIVVSTLPIIRCASLLDTYR